MGGNYNTPMTFRSKFGSKLEETTVIKLAKKPIATCGAKDVNEHTDDFGIRSEVLVCLSPF